MPLRPPFCASSPSSSGAAVTVDYSVPSGNKGQLDVFGSGAIIGASWATASTKIITHIRNIKKASIKKTGYQLAHCFYGENIAGYLSSNTEAKEYLARNPAMNQQILSTGEIPDGFMGLIWHPVDDAFFEDKNGTLQGQIGADDIVFVPEPSQDWYELVQGSFVIPTNLGSVTPDATAAVGSLTEVFGMYGYAKITDDPAGIKQFAGDTFLPTIKVPGAVFIADTTP